MFPPYAQPAKNPLPSPEIAGILPNKRGRGLSRALGFARIRIGPA